MTLAETVRLPNTFTGARWVWSRQRWLSLLALLLIWELGARLDWIPSRILAPPSSVAATLWDLAASGALAANLAVSLARAVGGLAIGVLVGAALALASGLSRLGEALVDPPVQMLRTLPSLALTPLFILWFGIGETPKVGLIALAVTIPIYLNLFNGIRSVDPKLIEAAQSFGLKGWSLVRHVVLPGAAPSFLLGLRFALAAAWLVLVVAEQINPSAGLGYLINNARDFMRTDIIVVCLLIYALLGLGADGLVRALEARALAWRPTFLKS